jgi:hypothetical protein
MSALGQKQTKLVRTAREASRDRKSSGCGRHAGSERSARWPGAGGILHHASRDRAHQSRQAACLGGDVQSALRGATGPSDHWRFLAGYEASITVGLGAPKNVAVEIIEKLNKETNAILAEPGMKARLADLGSEPTAMSPADFGKVLADETEKWAKVIRTANIKAE